MYNARVFQTQYKQYEAKWTSWREKLLERREQMRKKREQQKQAAATKVSTTAESDKNKSAGDDKILNILSNTENQRLINNLLGIGKTLGLTGKQQSSTPTVPSLPPPPPPPPETTTSGNQADIVAQVQQILPQQNVVGSNVAAPPPSWPIQQQWENNQYNPRMEAPSYGMPPSTMHHHPAAPFVHPMTSPNFTQPPPSLPSNNTGPPPNFSQPPPNYPPNNNNNNNQERSVALQNAPRGPASAQDQPSNMDMMRFARHPNDRGGNFDAAQQSSFPRRAGDPPDHRFPAGRGDSIANPSGNEQEQFMRPGDASFARPNEPFNDRIEAQQQRFRRDDRGFPGDFGNNPPNGSMNFHPNNEGRFGPSMNERFTGGNNRFGSERLPPPGDRPFASEHDRFGGVDRFSGGERFVGSEADRFGRGAGKEHIFDRPDSERFGQSDRFERFPDHKDRFSLASDRFAPNVNEHFGASDRFGRGNNPTDSFDPKDANDHRRDSFGGSSRLFGRNSVFSPSKELPPELRKLMEKRKAASDVFKPSFLSDSEKLSSVGSLSESFKKIAGDSPFRSSFDFPKIRPGGPSSTNSFSSVAGSRTSPPFQPHPFAPDPATSPYGHHLPRGGSFPFNSNNNTLDNEPPVPPVPGFRQGPFSENFVKHNVPVDYNEREMEKDMESELQNPNQQAQTTDIQSQSSVNYHSENPGADVNTCAINMEIDNVQDVQDMEITQPTNEVDSAAVEQKENPNIEEDLPKETNDNRKGDDIPNVSGNDDGSQQLQQQQDNKDQDNSSELRETAESNTDNKDKSTKKPESLPFMGENDPRPEDLNIEPPPELPNLGPIRSSPGPELQHVAGSFNEAFDGKGPPVGAQFDARPRGMEFPRMGPPFRFSGPPPLFNPRGPQGFPLERPGTFQLQSHDDNSQLGPKDGQFRSNAPGDAGQFSPRRPNDEQYTERDRSDESFNENPRNPNSGQFGPMNEPFPRSLTGKFGQVGLRGLVDLPFASRNSGLFGPRGNDMQFGPRGGLSDTHRHPGDGSQFSFLGPNNSNRFGRPNETPFDRRPPPFGFPDGRLRPSVSEGPPAFGPRGPNDSILSGPRGPPPDTFSQGRHSPKAFNENRFDSRDFNEGSFEPDFKDRSLPIRGPMGDTRDYMRRSGPYIRREQFENDKFENPAAKSDEPFNRNMMNTELRKDNVEYTRRIPPSQDPYKKDVDKKPPNEVQFDEGSRLEPKTTDFVDSSDKEPTDPKFHGPNLFTKRPQSMLSTGGGPSEFCAPRQFNYNHGEVSGTGGEKKTVEYTPSKVIDYGHTSRQAVVDQHLSPPVQCFDYAHGDSKPVERHRDQYQSKKDFRNWVENEQSLKDYAEQMRSCYENAKKEYAAEKAKCGSYEARRLAASDFTKQRMKEHHMDWQQQSHHQHQQQTSDRRTCGERGGRESEDRKERYNFLEEQRFFEHDSSVSDGQGDRNSRRGN